MFNFCIDKRSFPNRLKQENITPVHKNTTINRLAYHLLCLRLLKNVFMMKFILTLTVYSLSPNVGKEYRNQHLKIAITANET